MKLCLKPYLPVQRALVTGAGCFIAFFFGLTIPTNSAGISNPESDIPGIKIAAGYPMQPAAAPSLSGPAVPPAGYSSGISLPTPATPTVVPDNTDLLQKKATSRKTLDSLEPRLQRASLQLTQLISL